MSDEPSESPASLAIRKRVRAAADELSEHCDSVIILSTLQDQGETILQFASRGNSFANDGAVRAWMKSRDEKHSTPEIEEG